MANCRQKHVFEKSDAPFSNGDKLLHLADLCSSYLVFFALILYNSFYFLSYFLSKYVSFNPIAVNFIQVFRLMLNMLDLGVPEIGALGISSHLVGKIKLCSCCHKLKRTIIHSKSFLGKK